MFWGSMTDEQQTKLLNLAVSMEETTPDYLKHKDLLNKCCLTWFQCFCIEHTLISKGSIISLGTGLGKTMTAMGYIKLRLSENKDKKAIFFCLPESLEQICNDFMENTDLRLVAVSGEGASIKKLALTSFNSFDVLICSYQAIYNTDFANWLNTFMGFIDNCVFDEAHEIAQATIINSVCKIICRRVVNRMFLTATPITVSPVQFIHLIMMLDEEMIPGNEDFLEPYKIYNDDFEVVDYRELNSIAMLLYPRYVSWTRKELGLTGNYKPFILKVKPTEEQKECPAIDAPRLIKGDPNNGQAQTFYKTVQNLTAQHKTGLCYAYNREISESLCDNLRKQGVRAFVVNGDINNKKYRSAVLQLFKSGDVDILITNLTMSLNLSCDYLIFWQFTNRAVQMLGRCERGFMPRDLEIYFIITEDTVEVEQYQNIIYKRCKWLKEAFGKDIDIFERVSHSLE